MSSGPVVLVELLGGPHDGLRMTVPAAWARIEFASPSSTTPRQSLGDRLTSGERIAAAEVEDRPAAGVAVYARTSRAHAEARIFDYVVPAGKP